MNRRNALKNTLLASSIMTTEPLLATHLGSAALKGRVNHSFCRWCYSSIPFEELCVAAQEIGIKSIELTGPEEWPILAKYGLTCAIGWTKWPGTTGLPNFFNNPKNHDSLVKCYEEIIPQAAAAGVYNLICFSGNRNGLDDYDGLLNCQKVLKRIMPTAEKHKVTLTMELLSSLDSHPDYQCDRVKWGAVLCEMVGSPNFKLLYDIFHMQSMHGDHIRNIKKYGQYISHYHTGGHPGRHEIDETQEIYYPAIIKAIVETGYKGFIGQEFMPSAKDKAGQLAALKQAVLICDV